MRFRVISTAASLLAVAPGACLALGIGGIQLRSTLNAPLNAEIELTATPDELASLRVQLASRDAFSRYGLDYPAYFSSIQVRLERLGDGRNIIRMTSAAPITEPFATFLVEATSQSTVQRREYTVLFDPPSFAPVQTTVAPVAAPVTGAGDRSAAVVRQPAAAPATPSPASPATAPVSAAPAARPGEYTVRAGDSLSSIARRQYGTGDSDRAMIAIYRGNENAFDGNINRLRAGAVLRLPDNVAVAAVNAQEASAEIRRQVANWTRSDATGDSGGGADARLRLIPPGAAGSAGGSTGDNQALKDQIAALENQLAESRRLLEIQSADLARLKGVAAPVPAPAPSAPTPASPPATATEPAATPPAAVEPAPAPAEPAAEKPAAAPAPPPAADTGPSLVDRLIENWKVAAGVLAALLLLVFGVRLARRRRETRSDDLAPFAVAPGSGRDASSDTMPLRKPFADGDDPSILVEESGTHERLNLTRKDTRTIDLDDASTSMSIPALDATAALDQSDPLAEADFHMAYGLYDQAADLVKLAIQREPQRRDLKLKLLEVFFVWGNKDQFLQTARELSDSRDASAPGEWEKVVIMGKQLAPDDALFSQSYSGAGPSSVDLNLEGGQNLIDFDLDGEPSASISGDMGVDLDLNSTLRSNPSAASGLDFILDDPARGDDLARTATTRQMAQPGLAGLDDGGVTQRYPVDGPTVEQPGLGDIGDTLVGKIDAHSSFQGSDQTAELAIDDLGLDLGKFDATGTNASLLDDSQLSRALESTDSPTLVAGIDETARRMVEDANDAANQPTQLLPLGDMGSDTSGMTSRVSVLDLEFDLDSNAETGKRSALAEGDFSLDLDVGAAEQPADAQYTRTQLIDPPADATQRDLEPVTMSEVGTKLDLARAYMDMGDPDGARSILREVLQEGSANQRQEAQRLIDSIPG
jgi:pilus assembly protein FimV